MTTTQPTEETTMRVPPSPDATTPTDRTPEPVRVLSWRFSSHVAALDLDAIRARADAATPGPWERRIGPREGYSIKEKAKFMRGCALDNGEPLQVLIADSDRPGVDYLVPALTGDGPSAEANAEFIAHAREDVPALVDALARVTREAEALRAQVAAVEALADALTTAATVARRGGREDVGELVEALQGDLRAALATTGEGKCSNCRQPLTSEPCSQPDGKGGKVTGHWIAGGPYATGEGK